MKFNTIRSKLTIMIILSSILLIAIVGTVNIIESKKAIEQKARQSLYLMGKSYGNQFSKTMETVKSSVENLAITSLALFKLDEMRADSSYLERYQSTIEPIVKKIG